MFYSFRIPKIAFVEDIKTNISRDQCSGDAAGRVMRTLKIIKGQSWNACKLKHKGLAELYERRLVGIINRAFSFPSACLDRGHVGLSQRNGGRPRDQQTSHS